MHDDNKIRFIRAMSMAIDDLAKHAKCFGYNTDKDFVEIMAQMRACRDKIRDELRKNEESLRLEAETARAKNERKDG